MLGCMAYFLQKRRSILFLGFFCFCHGFCGDCLILWFPQNLHTHDLSSYGWTLAACSLSPFIHLFLFWVQYRLWSLPPNFPLDQKIWNQFAKYAGGTKMLQDFLQLKKYCRTAFEEFIIGYLIREFPQVKKWAKCVAHPSGWMGVWGLSQAESSIAWGIHSADIFDNLWPCDFTTCKSFVALPTWKSVYFWESGDFWLDKDQTQRIESYFFVCAQMTLPQWHNCLSWHLCTVSNPILHAVCPHSYWARAVDCVLIRCSKAGFIAEWASPTPKIIARQKPITS